MDPKASISLLHPLHHSAPPTMSIGPPTNNVLAKCACDLGVYSQSLWIPIMSIAQCDVRCFHQVLIPPGDGRHRTPSAAQTAAAANMHYATNSGWTAWLYGCYVPTVRYYRSRISTGPSRSVAGVSRVLACTTVRVVMQSRLLGWSGAV